MTTYVYLSPHLDDAVYSCGGLIAGQVRAGCQVRVITICAGDPPADSLSAFARELHARWGAQPAPLEQRRKEDRVACALLGADHEHWDVPDAIYRRNINGAWLYQDEKAIFGPLHADEQALVVQLGDRLREQLSSRDVVVTPLGIGGHVDHRLVCQLAEHAGERLWYYREIPYAWRGHVLQDELAPPEGQQKLVPLQSADVSTWIEAAACYQSQISTFWDDTAALRRDFVDGCARWGGLPIIQRGFHDGIPGSAETKG